MEPAAQERGAIAAILGFGAARALGVVGLLIAAGGIVAALASSPYSRRWLITVGAVVAVAHLVVTAAFATNGPLSPAGTVAHVVPCLWFAWVARACVVLLRSAGATRT